MVATIFQQEYKCSLCIYTRIQGSADTVGAERQRQERGYYSLHAFVSFDFIR